MSKQTKQVELPEEVEKKIAELIEEASNQEKESAGNYISLGTGRELQLKLEKLFIQAQQEAVEGADFDWNVKSINRVIKNYLLPRINNAVGNISDGYHTFNELYEFRKLYNAALFNEWANGWMHGFAVKYDVHKSKKHHDGEACFGGGWFIVMATLPTGQISNHYEMKDWDLFNIPEKEKANEWDGHTAQDVLKRLEALQKEQE